jgi:copper transport protein
MLRAGDAGGRRPGSGCGQVSLTGLPAYRVIRRVCGLLGALTTAGVVMVAVAPAASAHATLLFTSPAAGSAVPTSPRVITLTFNEPVTLAGTPVTLADPGGRRLGLGPARESGGRRAVTVPVAGRLPDGVYTVSWQVISSDGDLVGDQFIFAIGPAPASLGSALAPSQPSVPGQWPTAIFRWVLFAGLATALGGLAGRALARSCKGLGHPDPLPAPWALRGSLLGVAASAALAALILGSGNLAAGFAHPSVPRLLASGPGLITAVELVSFTAAAVLLRLRRPRWAVLPLLVVIGAEALRAHPERVLPVGGAMLTWVHLLSATLWAGMLLYVVRTAIAWRADPDAVRGVIRLYARAAAWLFAVVVVTGLVSALLLVPVQDLFTTVYGRVLVLKAALVAAAAALALAGRNWLRSRPQPGAGPALATRLESGTLAGVLAVTALLSTLAAPSLASAGGALAFPPPASGPLVPLGGRAGEVGIYATASAGQIVVHLSAPQETRAGDQQFTASMRLAGAHGTARTLAVRGCGQGCFVAPARWGRGDNLLTIQATAPGWTGGTTSLDVPWPPAAGEAILRRALTAMRRVPATTVYEQVTSNTALGSGTTHAIRVSGRQFLASEPYAGGVAPVADLVIGNRGHRILLLGFPDDGIWAQLTLGTHGVPDRVAHEILVDPDHLTSRGFGYPEKAGRTR